MVTMSAPGFSTIINIFIDIFPQYVSQNSLTFCYKDATYALLLHNVIVHHVAAAHKTHGVLFMNSNYISHMLIPPVPNLFILHF